MKRSAPQLRVGKKHTKFGVPLPGPLRLRRFTAGLALQDVARAAGISLTLASNIERGLRTSPESAAALDAAVTALAAVRP